jgi:hypothetical protein
VVRNTEEVTKVQQPLAPVFSMWHVVMQPTPAQVEWDISIMPLLFGPLAVLDNMIFDSPGLAHVLTQRDSARRLLKLLANRGLLRLWHRERISPDANGEILGVRELLLVWLRRSGAHRRTIKLYSTETHPYLADRIEELRSFVSRANKSDEQLRDYFVRFLAEYIPGYQDVPDCLDEVFFRNGPLARAVWRHSPRHYFQHRVLSSIGVPLDKAQLATRRACFGRRRLAEVLVDEGYLGPGGGTAQEVLMSRALDDSGSAEAAFVEALCHARRDTTFCDLVTLGEEISEHDLALGEWVLDVVNRVYVQGIPEANGGTILWAWPSGAPLLPNEVGKSALVPAPPDDIESACIEDDEYLIKTALEIPHRIRYMDDSERMDFFERRLATLRTRVFRSEKAQPKGPSKIGQAAAAVTALVGMRAATDYAVSVLSPAMQAGYEVIAPYAGMVRDAVGLLLGHWSWGYFYPYLIARESRYGRRAALLDQWGAQVIRKVRLVDTTRTAA